MSLPIGIIASSQQVSGPSERTQFSSNGNLVATQNELIIPWAFTPSASNWLTNPTLLATQNDATGQHPAPWSDTGDVLNQWGRRGTVNGATFSAERLGWDAAVGANGEGYYQFTWTSTAAGSSSSNPGATLNGTTGKAEDNGSNSAIHYDGFEGGIYQPNRGGGSGADLGGVLYTVSADVQIVSLSDTANADAIPRIMMYAEDSTGAWMGGPSNFEAALGTSFNRGGTGWQRISLTRTLPSSPGTSDYRIKVIVRPRISKLTTAPAASVNCVIRIKNFSLVQGSSAPWAGPSTTSGRLLVMGVEAATASGSDINDPAGWTQLPTVSPRTSVTQTVKYYYIANAAARSGAGGTGNAERITGVPGTMAMAGVLAEYKNIVPSSPLDVSSSAATTGTTQDTGATSASTGAGMAIAIFGVGSSPQVGTLSGAGVGYTLVGSASAFHSTNSSRVAICLAEKHLTTGAVQQCQMSTSPASRNASGIIGVFKDG